MTLLSILLVLKIAVTAVLVCIPFLFIPHEKLSAVLQVETKNSTLFRLYGVAILALLVGYGMGVVQAENGEFPWIAVIVGIVSNVGATLVLTFTGTGRRNRLSATFFGGISLLLVLSVLWPDLAMTKWPTVGLPHVL